MTAPGRRVPKNGLVAVLSAAPEKAKAGSSWLGSPPTRLRRNAGEADLERTFAPSTKLKVARGFVETCRLIPVMITFGIGLGVLFALSRLAEVGYWLAAALSGVVLLCAGAVAGAVAVAAKWLMVGRIGDGATVGPASLVMRGDTVPRPPAGKATRSRSGRDRSDTEPVSR